MKSFIIPTAFILLLTGLNSQTKQPFSFGFGFSSTLPVEETLGPDLSLFATPYLNIKFSRHEFLFGLDCYIIGQLHDKANYPLIIGGQGEYRYHFIKKDKKYNVFLNTTIQYVQYQNTCLFAQPYDYHPTTYCYDYQGEILKHKSLINTYGFGFEYNFFRRFSAYSVVGIGFNYSQLNELDGKPFHDGNRINIIGTFRIGLSFSVYKSSKTNT